MTLYLMYWVYEMQLKQTFYNYFVEEQLLNHIIKTGYSQTSFIRYLDYLNGPIACFNDIHCNFGVRHLEYGVYHLEYLL